MNWIDLIFIIILAATTALAAQRSLSGLAIGIAGVLLLKPLLMLLQLSTFLALIFAILLGLMLGIGGRLISRNVRISPLPSRILGGLGGFVLGLALLLVTVTSMPLERDLNGAIVYPPRNLTMPYAGALQQSRLADLGRDILLYPLLDDAGQIEAGQRAVLQGLHGLLIIKNPWEGG